MFIAPFILSYAPPVEEMSEMGVFGTAHIDAGDSVLSLTSMISNSDLPEGYKGGHFHLVDLGLFVALDGVQIMGFSGYFLPWNM